MTTALIYIRQSRHKDYERTASPEVQEAACRALPAVQRCDSVEVFTDLDVSGGKRARRGYDAMLARIHAGGVAVVAAYDQSRAFRSSQLAIEFRALLNEPGHQRIEVGFVHGSFERSALGGFSYTVLAAAHQMEREITGEKIRDAKRYAAARGQMVGDVPLGYKRADGAVAIDEGWALVVRRIFEDYASARFSTRTLADRLNAEGIRPPRFKTGWRSDTVAQLLGNIAYSGRTYSQRRSKQLGDLIPANWPAVVSVEQWEAVDRLLGRYHRKGGRTHQHDGQERAYEFQGLLRCAESGARLQVDRQWKRRKRTGEIWSLVYYRCRGASDHTTHGIREEGLIAWGRELMAFLESRSDQREEVAAALAAAADSPPYRSDSARESIEAQLARVGQRFEWGDIDADEYRQKREWLLAQLDDVTAAPPRPTMTLEGLLDAWDRADALGRRELLATLFVELEVRDGMIWRCQPRPEIADELWAHLRQWKQLPSVEAENQFGESSPGGIRAYAC